jgi:hypothetical protein
MRTGILVHGCHLEAFDWRGIVWGSPPHEPGRIPMAVYVAVKEDADVIVFGTGASERGGKKESEFTREYLLEHFSELEEFSCFDGMAIGQQRDRMEAISVAECDSRNTLDEMGAAGRIFLEKGIEKAILVSSPTHIPRCIRDALEVFQAPEFATLKRNLYAVASDTSYLGGRVEDVVIFEPPHRGDRGSFLTHYIVKRILKIPEDRTDLFLKELDALLAKFQV